MEIRVRGSNTSILQSKHRFRPSFSFVENSEVWACSSGEAGRSIVATENSNGSEKVDVVEVSEGAVAADQLSGLRCLDGQCRMTVLWREITTWHEDFR